MTNGIQDLYSLLPAVYRERDAQQNFQLQALLSLLSKSGSRARRPPAAVSRTTCSSRPARTGSFPISAISSATTCCSTRAAAAKPTTARSRVYRSARKGFAAAGRDAHSRRRRQDDLLSPAQGHAGRCSRSSRGTSPAGRRMWSNSSSLLGWTSSSSIAPGMHLDRPALARRHGAHRRRLRPDHATRSTCARRPSGGLVRRAQYRLLSLAPAELATGQRAGTADLGTMALHFSPLGNPAPLFSRTRRDTEGLGRRIRHSGAHSPRAVRKGSARLREACSAASAPDFTRLYGAFGVDPTDPSTASQTSLYVG